MNSSIAIVIEGHCGVGALISRRKPASSTAMAVAGPNAAITVVSWTKSGKFWNKDLIPDGV